MVIDSHVDVVEALLLVRGTARLEAEHNEGQMDPFRGEKLPAADGSKTAELNKDA